MRLRPKEVKAYRLKLLKKQSFICPLCEKEIKEHEATLDHRHSDGYCRRVLHRSCNQVEGRILSWIRRSRSDDELLYLKNLVQYWETDWRDQPIHPNHRSDIEKEILKLQRKMKKVKRERTKQKYQDMINKLKEKV